MNSLALNSGFSSPAGFSLFACGEWPSWARRGIAAEKTTKTKNRLRYLIVFKPNALYKDFFFNVFTITIIENNENAKYSTKNNKMYSAEVFFAPTNHTSAIKSSARNFIPTAAKVCIACITCSLDNPLLKVNISRKVDTANENASETVETSLMPSRKIELVTTDPQEITRNSISNGKKYFRYPFIT
jgi:hypothetical protein